MRVSANYFDLTGARVHRGRAIQPDDEQRAVALVSHGMWQRRFGGRTDAVGTSIVLNGETFTVIGILRPDFVSLVRDVDLVVPYSPAADVRRGNRAQGFLRVVARLKPGTTDAQAADDLTAIGRRLGDEYPDSHGTDTAVRVARLHDEISGRSAPMLWMLLGAVVVVMLVACANLANLFLVRATTRQRELALRTALGASRSRIVGHVLGEAAVLGVLGGAAGLLVARMLVAALLAIGPADLPRVAEIGIRVVGRRLHAAGGAWRQRPHRTRAGGASLAGGSPRRAPGWRTWVEPRRASCAHRPGVRGSRALHDIADDGRGAGAQLPAGAGRRSRLPSGAGSDRPAVAATRAVQRAVGDRELLQPGAAPPRVDRRSSQRGGRQRRAHERLSRDDRILRGRRDRQRCARSALPDDQPRLLPRARHSAARGAQLHHRRSTRRDAGGDHQRDVRAAVLRGPQSSRPPHAPGRWRKGPSGSGDRRRGRRREALRSREGSHHRSVRADRPGARSDHDLARQQHVLGSADRRRAAGGCQHRAARDRRGRSGRPRVIRAQHGSMDGRARWRRGASTCSWLRHLPPRRCCSRW